MLKLKKFMILAASAVMASACARGMQSSDAGVYIDPAEAAKTVTLEVQNDNPNAMELRVIVNDQSYFVGSVGGAEKTALLLDSRLGAAAATMHSAARPPAVVIPSASMSSSGPGGWPATFTGCDVAISAKRSR